MASLITLAELFGSGALQGTGVDYARLTAALRARDLPGVKLDRRWMVDPADVTSWRLRDRRFMTTAERRDHDREEHRRTQAEKEEREWEEVVHRTKEALAAPLPCGCEDWMIEEDLHLYTTTPEELEAARAAVTESLNLDRDWDHHRYLLADDVASDLADETAAPIFARWCEAEAWRYLESGAWSFDEDDNPVPPPALTQAEELELVGETMWTHISEALSDGTREEGIYAEIHRECSRAWFLSAIQEGGPDEDRARLLAFEALCRVVHKWLGPKDAGQ